MGYEWTGARERRMKVARYSAAVTLAALVVTVAAQIVSKAF
ncbi:hypothetical protein SAMN03159448_06617 [Sinorhizobium sp. NFACC03]|nr:hypothetical protein SAMN03159448_06617 [Sinorhizobium sp. NFACC03]